MQQIAGSAGVTKATLYHHFRDKEDLFFEVMRAGFLGSQEKLASTIEEGQTLREQMVAFASYLFSAERADLNRLFLDLHQHVNADRQAEFWQTFPRPWSYLEKSIAAGIAAGDIAPGDPVIIARVCYSAFVGQMQIARFHNSIPYPDAALAGQITDMLLNGLRPR
jgi:AcrR family transcriptional regulator